jgi:hypothetical protein
MLKAGIFREYDIRGIADEELLDPDVELLGRGSADHACMTLCYEVFWQVVAQCWTSALYRHRFCTIRRFTSRPTAPS